MRVNNVKYVLMQKQKRLICIDFIKSEKHINLLIGWERSAKEYYFDSSAYVNINSKEMDIVFSEEMIARKSCNGKYICVLCRREGYDQRFALKELFVSHCLDSFRYFIASK